MNNKKQCHFRKCLAFMQRLSLCFPICIFSLVDGAIATEDVITSKNRRKTQYSHFKNTSKQAKVTIRHNHFYMTIFL